MIIAFSVTILVARYLGPSRYGTLSYCWSVMGILAGLNALGWDRLILTELSANRRDPSRIMQTQLALRLCGAVLAAVISLAIIIHTKPGDRESLNIIAICGAASVISSAMALEVYFLANLESKTITPIRLIVPLISAFLKVGIVINNGSITHLAAVGLLETAIVSLYIFLAYMRRTKKLPLPKIDVVCAGAILKRGWPLFVALQICMLSEKIYGVVLPSYMTEYQYGQFMMALRMVEIPLIIIYLSTSSLSPRMTRLYSENYDKYHQNLRIITEVGNLIGVLSWGVIALVGPSVIQILLSSNYSQTGELLVLLWGAVFVQLNSMLRAQHLIIVKAESTLLISNFAGLIASVPLAALCIGIWNWKAAAAAFSVTVLVTYFISGCLTKSGREFMAIQIDSLRLRELRNLLGERKCH